jgi:histidyl-tRNA synthetase
MDASGRSVKAQFKLADREKAAFCITVGEQELTDGTVVLKEMATSEQTKMARDQIVATLKDLVSK